MFLSVSRRTDIPAFYSEWFYNRIDAGFLYVRNPMNIHQISKIRITPDVVDGIVFWSKNPGPLLKKLNKLADYNYYFQFTLTPYGHDIEPNVPSKNNEIIPLFQKLSDKIGKDKVIWRYDPILFNENYSFDYHVKYFEVLAKKLSPYTDKCTVSFVDMYKNAERNMKPFHILAPTNNEQISLMRTFSEIAHSENISLDTCAELADFNNYGITHAHCIDQNLFERIGKCRYEVNKDPNQREECGCIASIDVGAYNTCKNGCVYCYANYNMNIVKNNSSKHNSKSPLLFGDIGTDDVIKERKVKSCRDCQINIFDF